MRIPTRIVAALSLAALAGMAILIPAGRANADAQAFTIPIFEADYYLSRDSKSVSHMRVHEHIVARFPQTNTNHGIQRILPRVYDGHRVSLRVQSVTDDAGRKLDYSQSRSDNDHIITIGSLTSYVHDLQSYNIDYTVDNVTTHTASFDAQTWAVNGYSWGVEIGQATARVHLTSDLDGTVESRATRCTTGPQNTTARSCTVQSSTAESGESILSFTATRALQAGESLGYSLRFVPNTFAIYRHSATTGVSHTLYIAVLYIVPLLILLYFLVHRLQLTRLEYTTEITIDAPLRWVSELYEDPKNAPHWHPNLAVHKLISGTSGQPGAKSALTYSHHKHSIEVTETILARNFPTEFTALYETRGIKNLVKNFFVEVDKDHTKWVSVDNFEFSGSQRLAAAFRPRIFRRESRKYLENFKVFAEKGQNAPKAS
jgi:hypothetical protein